MSRLFRRPSTKAPQAVADEGDLADESGFEALLEDELLWCEDCGCYYNHRQQDSQHGSNRPAAPANSRSPPATPSYDFYYTYGFSTTLSEQSPAPPPRHWLSAAEARRVPRTDDRAARKLVKEPSQSSRPRVVVEISESDGEDKKNIVRRKMERLKELYRGK